MPTWEMETLDEDDDNYRRIHTLNNDTRENVLGKIKSWKSSTFKFSIDIHLKQRVRNHLDDDLKIVVDYSYVC